MHYLDDKNPDAGIFLHYNDDKYSQGYSQVEEAFRALKRLMFFNRINYMMILDLQMLELMKLVSIYMSSI